MTVKPRSLPRVAGAYLAHVAAVGAVPDAEIPAVIRKVLLDLALVEPAAIVAAHRLSRAGALAVLRWRETQGAELAGKALWLIEHLREGHVELRADLSIAVKAFPFSSTSREVSLARWRSVRANVVGSYFPEDPL